MEVCIRHCRRWRTLVLEQAGEPGLIALNRLGADDSPQLDTVYTSQNWVLKDNNGIFLWHARSLRSLSIIEERLYMQILNHPFGWSGSTELYIGSPLGAPGKLEMFLRGLAEQCNSLVVFSFKTSYYQRFQAPDPPPLTTPLSWSTIQDFTLWERDLPNDSDFMRNCFDQIDLPNLERLSIALRERSRRPDATADFLTHHGGDFSCDPNHLSHISN